MPFRSSLENHRAGTRWIHDDLGENFPQIGPESEKTVIVAFTAKTSLCQRIFGKSRIVLHIVATCCPACGAYNLHRLGSKAWNSREGDFHSSSEKGRRGYWEVCCNMKRNRFGASQGCRMPRYLDRVPDEIWEKWHDSYDEKNITDFVPRDRYYWVDIDNSLYSEREMSFSAFEDTIDKQKFKFETKGNPPKTKEEIWQKLWKGKGTLEICSTIIMSTELDREGRPKKKRQRTGAGPSCPKCGGATNVAASHAEYTKKMSQTHSCVNENCKFRWVEKN